MTKQTHEEALVAEAVLDIEEVALQIAPAIQSPNGASPHSDLYFDQYSTIKLLPNGYKFSTNGNQYADISYEDLITEDDEPVDNIPSEKQQRLLVEPLHNSNHIPGLFLAAANVGVFDTPKRPAIVPDMFLSLGVTTEGDLMLKENRSYFVWKYGKPPEVVVECVSNRKGNETGTKFARYAAMGVKYYVILDRDNHVQDKPLVIYELKRGEYFPRDDHRLPDLNLSLTFWQGKFEDTEWPWIRWCTFEGDMLLTGIETTKQQRIRAEQAEDIAEQERIRAEQAEDIAEQEGIRAEQEKAQASQAKDIAEQERIRAEQAEDIAEQEGIRAEQEKAQAAQAKDIAEQERIRAEQAENIAGQERVRAEQEKAQAAQAKGIAEQERIRAEQAEDIAEQERVRAEQEKERAEQAEERTALLLQKLREAGINLELQAE